MAAGAAQQQVASGAIEEFLARYNAAVGVVEQLLAEGAALSAALKTSILMPPPMPPPEMAVVIDDAVARAGQTLDRIDGALTLLGGVRQSRLLDQRHYALAQQRGQLAEHGGLYMVKVQFQCMLDGEMFEVGRLVDESLLGSGSIARLQAGRKYIMPVGLVTNVAAA